LPQPEISIAGQQPVAEQQRIESQGKVLDEMPALCNQHLFNVVGMEKDENGTRAKSQRNDVAVFVHALRQKSQPIALKFAEISAEESAWGARG
jgi:hypothetical protein